MKEVRNVEQKTNQRIQKKTEDMRRDEGSCGQPRRVGKRRGDEMTNRDEMRRDVMG